MFSLWDWTEETSYLANLNIKVSFETRIPSLHSDNVITEHGLSHLSYKPDVHNHNQILLKQINAQMKVSRLFIKHYCRQNFIWQLIINPVMKHDLKKPSPNLSQIKMFFLKKAKLMTTAS